MEDLWYFDFLHEDELLRYSQGQMSSIAILDTGIDTHATFPVAFNPEKSIDLTGYNSINDNDGHGTMCAAAIKGKGDLIRGIAPQTDLQVIKAYEKEEALSSGSLIKGLQQAIDNSADIISMSLELRSINSQQNIDLLSRLIKQAREKEIIMVCAIGNRSAEPEIRDDIYLGLFNDCFSVGSVNDHKSVSEVTIISHNCKILVPGENIRVVRNNNEISSETSTSIATAIASALVSLLLSYIKENGMSIKPYELLEIIKTKADLLQYRHPPSGDIFPFKVFNPLATFQYLKQKQS
ncbi:MAG: S8/S53 family peptidase [Bacteroidetes bacterium]|nr:S8/S53 family peptidase [Bacteroidota bacterium]